MRWIICLVFLVVIGCGGGVSQTDLEKLQAELQAATQRITSLEKSNTSNEMSQRIAAVEGLAEKTNTSLLDLSKDVSSRMSQQSQEVSRLIKVLAAEPPEPTEEELQTMAEERQRFLDEQFKLLSSRDQSLIRTLQAGISEHGTAFFDQAGYRRSIDFALTGTGRPWLRDLCVSSFDKPSCEFVESMAKLLNLDIEDKFSLLFITHTEWDACTQAVKIVIRGEYPLDRKDYVLLSKYPAFKSVLEKNDVKWGNNPN